MANEPHTVVTFSPNFFFFNSISNFHFYGDNEARKKVKEYKTRGAPTPPDTIPIQVFWSFLFF